MSQTPLWQLSACDVAARIAAGDVSSSDVVSQAVERMRAVNPKLNGVVDDLGDEAIAEANRIHRTLDTSRPLLRGLLSQQRGQFNVFVGSEYRYQIVCLENVAKVLRSPISEFST